MESTLGWVDISPAALRRMRQQLEGDGDGVVDEMGVLSLHSGYADHFFPGTSVLHRRPRYLFFTCWNYLTLADDDTVSARNVRRRKEELEHWVTDQLRKAGQRNIIGQRIFPRAPAQPPDAVYWSALNTFRFYRGVDRSTLLAKWEGQRVSCAGDAPIGENDSWEEDQLGSFHVPQPPHYWGRPRPREPLTFDLTRGEANFLLDRLTSLDTCLLSEAAVLASHKRPKENAPWREPLLLEAADRRGERAMLLRTESVSAMGMLVRGIYAALVEQLHERTLPPATRKALEAPQHFRNTLATLREDGTMDEAARLSLSALREDLPELRESFVELLSHVQKRLERVQRKGDVERMLLDRDTHALFETVERERKGAARARLPDTPAGLARRQGFGPKTLRVYGLDFRWGVVSTLLDDLYEGLNR